MCMMVYVAADQPLPLVEWRKDTPAFHVRGIARGEESVRRQFTKHHVYAVGSHEGCACPFLGPDTPEAWESVRRLSVYLAGAAEAGDVELYYCWLGEEGDPPAYSVTVTSAEIGGAVEKLREKLFLTIRKAAGK